MSTSNIAKGVGHMALFIAVMFFIVMALEGAAGPNNDTFTLTAPFFVGAGTAYYLSGRLPKPKKGHHGLFSFSKHKGETTQAFVFRAGIASMLLIASPVVALVVGSFLMRLAFV